MRYEIPMRDCMATHAVIANASDKSATFEVKIGGEQYSLSVEIDNCKHFTCALSAKGKQVAKHRIAHERMACSITRTKTNIAPDGTAELYVFLMKRTREIALKFEIGGECDKWYCEMYDKVSLDDDFESWGPEWIAKFSMKDEDEVHFF